MKILSLICFHLPTVSDLQGTREHKRGQGINKPYRIDRKKKTTEDEDTMFPLPYMACQFSADMDLTDGTHMSAAVLFGSLNFVSIGPS